MGIDVNREFNVDEEISERDISITFKNAFSEALSNNPEYKKARSDLAPKN